MDILKSPLLSGLIARMQHLAARTGVIASNIANADTPGYAARDVRKPDFRTMAARPLATSDARHIQHAAAAGAGVRIEAAPDPDAALNGNRVSIETQMMKLSETRMDYQLASGVYRKAVEMVRLAARGGR